MSDAQTSPAPRQEVPDRLLDAAGISVDRLPMLRVVFDRLGTHCADSLRHMSASPFYFTLIGISTGRIGEVLDAYDENAIAAVFHSPEWDSRILMGFDRRFVFTAIEGLFGADGSEPPNTDERPFSNLETRVAQALFEHVAKGLKASFASVAEASFKFERIETRMDFAVIGRRNNLAVVAKLEVQALDQGGEMFIIIPQSALNPMRQNLARAVTGDASSRDPRWAKQIQKEVQRTEVTLTAILEERPLTLGEITELKVGDILELNATPTSRVKVKCNDEALFWCQLGQSQGFYTLRLDDFVDQEEEFLDDILRR
jgi:flagellar motor switch protein FliM